MAFRSIFDTDFQILIKYKYPIIIKDDLKVDILNSSTLTEEYHCTLAANGSHFTNNAPPRVSADLSSCIDHIIDKNADKDILKKLDDCLTDHFRYY